MKHQALIRYAVIVCALSLVGCNKTGTATDTSVNSAGGNTEVAGNPGSTNPGDTSLGPNSASTAPSAASAAPARRPIVVSPGTEIVVTADQAVSSKTSNSGDRFDASLAEPVVVGDRVVIPRGARASGTEYRVRTTQVTEAGKGRGKRTAEGAGGGAVVGGLIGALAGHGKGAAIGAAAGAGAGTAGVAFTGERDITIDPESRLSFKLQNALEIERK
jgi:hypothetical protein